jgi:hypothetical protein
VMERVPDVGEEGAARGARGRRCRDAGLGLGAVGDGVGEDFGCGGGCLRGGDFGVCVTHGKKVIGELG